VLHLLPLVAGRGDRELAVLAAVDNNILDKMDVKK
jgi:hypothetical protein